MPFASLLHIPEKPVGFVVNAVSHASGPEMLGIMVITYGIRAPLAARPPNFSAMFSGFVLLKQSSFFAGNIYAPLLPPAFARPTLVIASALHWLSQFTSPLELMPGSSKTSFASDLAIKLELCSEIFCASGWLLEKKAVNRKIIITIKIKNVIMYSTNICAFLRDSNAPIKTRRSPIL